MKISSSLFNKVFKECIERYHLTDNINAPNPNDHNDHSIEFILFNKCWIDTIQWHMEDLIRMVDIDPNEALTLKRDIDASNQRRTDMVEEFEDFVFNHFRDVEPKPNARLNTETIGWAMDRLSILNLKLYHFKEELLREGISESHRQKCAEKVSILEQQYEDLSNSIDSLLDEIANGLCRMKVYRQMKMYNDDELNPVLRKK